MKYEVRIIRVEEVPIRDEGFQGGGFIDEKREVVFTQDIDEQMMKEVIKTVVK